MKTNLAFSEGLASLRGLAAVVVVVYHALLIFQVDGNDNPHRTSLEMGDGWLTAKHLLISLFNGPAAVVLFFVLSGTVLALSLARSERLSGREILAFYARRAFRLFPLLCAVTLASAWMHHIYFGDEQFEATTTWMGVYYKVDPGLKQVLLNALGWSNSLNSPAWTIRVEIAASVAFPILYWVSTRSVPVVITGGLALLAVMLAPGLSVGHIETYLLAFYLGALIPRFGAPLVQAFFRQSYPARTMIVCVVLTLVMSFNRLFTPDSFHPPITALVVMLGSALLVAVVYYGPRTGLLRWRIFLFLGEISYGLYLIHFLVLFMLAHALAPRLASLSPGEALVLNIGLAVATISLTVPLATATYYGIEKPCQHLGYRLASVITGSSRLWDALCIKGIWQA